MNVIFAKSFIFWSPMATSSGLYLFLYKKYTHSHCQREITLSDGMSATKVPTFYIGINEK